MEDDVFDSDEVQNRRCEAVETTSFGSIFARCSGDPADPLVRLVRFVRFVRFVCFVRFIRFIRFIRFSMARPLF